MTNQETQPTDVIGDDQKESAWKNLFHDWILHYLLPGLIALAVAGWGLLAKQNADERKLEEQVEEIREAIRKHGGGEAANVCFLRNMKNTFGDNNSRRRNLLKTDSGKRPANSAYPRTPFRHALNLVQRAGE